MDNRWRTILPAAAGAAALLSAAMLVPAAGAQGPGTECGGKGLPPAQIRCFLDAAEAAGDAAVCEGAKEHAVRFNCLSLYAERRGDPEACARITAPGREGRILRQSCVAGVAVATRAPALCARVTMGPVRDSCYTQLVLERGGDVALCGRIENAALRSACASGPAK